MSEIQQLQAKIAQLEASLKATKKASKLTLKVSAKGALSLYGMGRFPVTLYVEQWERVIAFAPEVTAFIDKNRDSLKLKGEEVAAA